MALNKFTQVYRPNGDWVGSFYSEKYARDWVKQQENSAGYEVTDRRPEIDVKPR